MRAVTIVATALILLVALAGCGQKGALYRDHHDASALVAATPTNSAPRSSEAQSSRKSDK